MRPTRRRRAALVAALPLALAASWLVASPVAAINVANDAELRAAWANAAETLITLTADITLGCEPDQPERDSSTNVVIEGGGHTLTQPCESDDALHQDGTGTVTVRNLIVVGNDLADDGIDTDGSLIVEGSNVSGFGESGLESDSPISVTTSTVSGNGGTGVQSSAGVDVTSSTISDNDALGVVTGEGSPANITNSTVSGNAGTGVQADGVANIVRSTIAENGHGIAPAGEIGLAGFGGGDDGVSASSAVLRHSTVVDNSFAGVVAQTDISAVLSTISGNAVNLENPIVQETIDLGGSVVIDAEIANCIGVVDDEGDNFVDDDSCGSIAPNAADPMLGPLASNGGPTQTRLPAAGSPLIDQMTPAEGCVDVGADQRGVTRPQGAACDIGAVEVQAAVGGSPTPTPTPTGSPAPTPTPTTGQLPNTASGSSASPMAALAAALLVVALAALVSVRMRRPT